MPLDKKYAQPCADCRHARAGHPKDGPCKMKPGKKQCPCKKFK